MKRDFSVGQMAKILNVARTTIINWIKAGKLEAFNLPGGNNRVTRENFIKFMNNGPASVPQADNEIESDNYVEDVTTWTQD